MHLCKNLQCLILLALFAVAWPAVCPAGDDLWLRQEGAGVLREHLEGPGWRAVIDWQHGVIEVNARGGSGRGRAKNRAMAEARALKAARMRAYQGLARTLDQVRLSESATVRLAARRNGGFDRRLSALVKGARVLEEATWPFGKGPVSARVRLALPFARARGFAGPAFRYERQTKTAQARFAPRFKHRAPARPTRRSAPLPAKMARPPRVAAPPILGMAPQESGRDTQPAPRRARPSRTYSGLIIVASGLAARPALFPLVKEKASRKVVYGPDLVSQDTAINHGVVGYAASLRQALRSKRAGSWPLVVKALGTEGRSRCNLLISYLDAVRIFAADLKANFIRRGRVVIVLN